MGWNGMGFRSARSVKPREGAPCHPPPPHTPCPPPHTLLGMKSLDLFSLPARPHSAVVVRLRADSYPGDDVGKERRGEETARGGGMQSP
jgi:hypothetical protein